MRRSLRKVGSASGVHNNVRGNGVLIESNRVTAKRDQKAFLATFFSNSLVFFWKYGTQDWKKMYIFCWLTIEKYWIFFPRIALRWYGIISRIMSRISRIDIIRMYLLFYFLRMYLFFCTYSPFSLFLLFTWLVDLIRVVFNTLTSNYILSCILFFTSPYVPGSRFSRFVGEAVTSKVGENLDCASKLSLPRIYHHSHLHNPQWNCWDREKHCYRKLTPELKTYFLEKEHGT